MGVLNSIIFWLMKKRQHQMELFIKYPIDVQEEVRRKLVSTAKNTAWGKQYGYAKIKTAAEFKEQVPINTYEQIQPYINRIMLGEQNLLWPSEIRWFAKSSGTTNDKSKFIPVSEEALEDCHFKAGKDMLSIYCNWYEDTNIFSGKGLTLGGSHQISELNNEMFYGDLSAVLMQNLPFWVEFIRTPDLSIALMDHWEDKISAMGKYAIKEDVTNAAGVPTWTLLLFQWILKHTGKDNILDVWPNFELYMHGGVCFDPYRAQFENLSGGKGNMRFMESYNASEGYFGIQNDFNESDMLLMLDYGIYFEFLPMEHIHEENPKTLSLEEVELDTNYALIISTNSGLWRYNIGDTIKFTQLNPFKFQLSGRTKHFINVFGEELIVDNADTALLHACNVTGALINDYTAGPVFLTDHAAGCHEWVIEFEKVPNSLDDFRNALDEKLKQLNSDYEAKRRGNLALTQPIISPVPAETFYKWMKKRGKLGGQNKVPRLFNTRRYVEEVKEMVG